MRRNDGGDPAVGAPLRLHRHHRAVAMTEGEIAVSGLVVLPALVVLAAVSTRRNRGGELTRP